MAQVWRCVASVGSLVCESYDGPKMATEAEMRAELDAARQTAQVSPPSGPANLLASRDS